MKKKIIFSTALLFALVGCLKDEGNYDYGEIVDVKLTAPYFTVLTSGETKIIAPEIKLPQGYTTEFDYEWKIEGVVVSTEPKLTYTAKKVGDYEGFLLVTDQKSGLKYNYRFNIKVDPYYLNGFVVLSEDGASNSELHYIRGTYIRGNSSAVPPIASKLEYVAEKMNLYKEINGNTLEGRPVSITEHFAFNDYGTVFGEITVITDKEGKKQVIELNGADMDKATELSQEFTGGVIPANFDPKTIIHTSWDSYILNGDGSLYPRRAGVGSTYHTGFFDKDITLWGKVKFTDLLGTFYPNTNVLLAIKQNTLTLERNYTAIYCDEHSPRRNGTEMLILPSANFSEENMTHFRNIADQIVCTDFCRFDENAESSVNVQSVLMKNSAGQYILHTYSWELNNRESIAILKSVKLNLTTEKMLPKVNGMITLKNRFVTLVYDDNAVYYHDFGTGNFGQIHTFAGKKIVSVAVQSQQAVGEYEYPTHVAVAFDDGSVEIWEFAYTDITKFSKKVYQSTGNFGKIKQIIFKVGTDDDYFNQY